LRRFAFVLHPLRFDDFARKYPITRYLPKRAVEMAFKHVRPVLVGHVTGVHSLSGEDLEGWLIGLPLTPEIIMNSPYEWILQRLEMAGNMAQDLGAEILGLGAFTKIAGDRGVTLAQHLHIPVTTGNSYTTATAVEGTLEAARAMGIPLQSAQVTVLGGTGSIGRATCAVLAPSIQYLRIVARHLDTLTAMQKELRANFPHLSVEVSTDARAAVRDADVVVAVSSAPGAIIEPQDLKPGSVITDVARPRNISGLVTRARHDVLVLDGGVIEVPGIQADMGFNFGFPPKMVEACMAETMILALSGRLENFTLGADISVAKVEEIHRLGRQHGFKLAGFRRFERAIDMGEIEAIRQYSSRRVPEDAQTVETN
jgi:predicted amino acid dehydrogenase